VTKRTSSGPTPRGAGSARIRVRAWTTADIPALVEVQRRAYPDYDAEGSYDARHFELQFAAFPEGQCLAEAVTEAGTQIVGYCTSLVVQLDDDGTFYEYNELTGSGTFSTHTPGGDTLYGADLAVVPSFRGKGVAGKMYQFRKRILRRYNLRRMIAYGRLTGYGEVKGEMTAEEYVQAVIDGELADPALRAHLKAGYRVTKVSLEIMRDPSSLDWATLLELDNDRYNPQKRRIAATPLKKPVAKIRVCAAQYLMRPMKGWDTFAGSVRFFAEVADEYHGHFLVYPELFSVVRLPELTELHGADMAMTKLAEESPRVLELLVELAREFGLYIIGGTLPMLRDGKLYNVSSLITPAGNVYHQDKLHVTPSEHEAWGIRPGDAIRVFETPFGRVAIQVCYDIEFPEVSRLLGLAGVDVLFVPFSTDERKAYQRVRIAAASRAMENAMYVVIAGNAGNMPARNYLLNYARSAILTPSDFGFPDDAVITEADPNVETVVVADLDLSALAQFRQDGTVRPLRDRRVDLYEIRARHGVKVVPVD